MEPLKSETTTAHEGDQLYVYIDGQYYREQDAKISVFDHIVLYGDGVFDTCCAWNGKIFKLDQHISRLYRSAHSIGISIPLSRPDFKEAVIETVRRCKLRSAFIRPLVTRGTNPQPHLDPRNCKPSIIIIVTPYTHRVGPEKMRKGIKCKTSSIRRTPDQCLDSKVKCCNYLNLVLMRMEAINSGVENAIALTTDGSVAEAAGYNVFVVSDGQITTPSEHVLLGITRETVIEIANSLGINLAQDRRLTAYDMYVADEAFLSSSTGGIIPVVELDSRIIGRGQPGPITQKIQAAYEKMLEEGVHGISIY